MPRNSGTSPGATGSLGAFARAEQRARLVRALLVLRLMIGPRKLREGFVIGRYTLVARIGSGGFGSVWSAHDELGREFALKIPHPDVIGGPDQPKGPTATQRFRQEARLIQQLDHPGLVRIHEIVEQDEAVVAYAMERLNGVDLGAVADQIDLRTLLAVMAHVAATLAFIHEKGVIHRDVKPTNVFLAKGPRGGRVKLLDLGTAKKLSPTVRLTPTTSGSLVGTLRVMAPESFMSTKVGPAVDQWGIGVTLFRCLCGRFPFDGHSLLEVIRQIEKDVPQFTPAPRFQKSPLLDELERVVFHCLEKRPDRRFASLADVSRALRMLIECIDAESAADTFEDSTIATVSDDGPTLRLKALEQKVLPPPRLASC